MVEVLKQLDLLPADETAAAAIRSLLGETEDQRPSDVWPHRRRFGQGIFAGVD